MKVLSSICHCIFAYLFGYFWDCCVQCGTWFGGHQLARFARIGALGVAAKDEPPCVGVLLCHECTKRWLQEDPVAQAHVNHSKHHNSRGRIVMEPALLSGYVWFDPEKNRELYT